MKLDAAERSDRERHTVGNPDGPDIQFFGALLIDQQSTSGGRIRVFKSDSGPYVLEQYRSAFRGREPLYRVAVVEDLDELAENLADTHGGKEVMASLGRPCIINL